MLKLFLFICLSFFCWYFNLLPFLAIYTVCSIHFGIIISKIFKIPDPRTIGSHNAGATNVFRTNKIAGVLTFLLDASKGFFSIFLYTNIYKIYLSDSIYQILPYSNFHSFLLKIQISEFLCLLCILGHMFPIFMLLFSNTKPAKGIAIFFGTIVHISQLGFLIAIFIWILMLLIFRISAISGITSVVGFCLYEYYVSNISELFLFLLPAIVIYAHRKNIKKLLNI